jgi:hypothetical protein
MKIENATRFRPDCNDKTVVQGVITKNLAPVLLTFCFLLVALLIYPRITLADVSVPGSVNFGSCNVYDSESRTVTLVNDGSNPVTITINDGELGEGFTLVNPVGTIPAGESKSFVVTFEPLLAKVFQGRLSVSYLDDDTPPKTISKIIEVEGSGVFGINNFISVASSLNFGNCVIENEKKSFLRFFNNSGTDVIIRDQVLPKGTPFTLSKGTIRAHSMLDVVVSFKPQSIQDFRVNLKVLYDKYVPSSNIILTGSGVYDSTGVLEAPSRVDFGTCNVGRTKKAVLLFVNSGSVDIQIQSVYLPYEGIFSEISGTIPAFGSKEFLIEFTPNSLQYFNTVMQVVYKNGVPASLIALSGTGTAQPEVAVAPSFIQFGKLGAGMSRTETVVLRNTGDVEVKVSTVEVLPSGMFTVTGIASDTTLKVGESKLATVKFNPVAAGSFSAVIRIVFDNTLDSGPNGSLDPFEIQLDGSASEVLINPETLDFSGSLVGDPVTRSITISNCLEHNLQVMSVATGTDDFTFAGIAVGDVITAKGALSCTITFHSNSSSLFRDVLAVNLAPVPEASIPENEIDMGTQYTVSLQAIPNVEFTPIEYDTFTADSLYSLSISASSNKVGQLYVLLSHAPLSNGAIYAVASDGTLKPFPYQSTSGWQNLWYQKGTIPGTIIDLSSVDLRPLGCSQCQGPEEDEEFHFGDIIITHPVEDYNNASEFKFMTGILYMATYVKDPLGSTGKPFDFNQGLLEVQTLRINSLAGTWQVTSEYNGVDRIHPTHLVVTEAGDGNISAFWPGYNVTMAYDNDKSGYIMTFSLGIYHYTYNITFLTADNFSGTYTCIANGEVLDAAPISGVRLQ